VLLNENFSLLKLKCNWGCSRRFGNSYKLFRYRPAASFKYKPHQPCPETEGPRDVLVTLVNRNRIIVKQKTAQTNRRTDRLWNVALRFLLRTRPAKNRPTGASYCYEFIFFVTTKLSPLYHLEASIFPRIRSGPIPPSIVLTPFPFHFCFTSIPLPLKIQLVGVW